MTAMTPVSPMNKCLSSRKRQRSSVLHQEDDDDQELLLSLSNDDCTSEEDLDLFDDEELLAEYPTSKRARASMAHEISGLQTSVRQMEKQVAQASASIQELRSLVTLLVAQRQQQRQQQHAAMQCA